MEINYCSCCFEPLEERFVYCPICGEPTGKGDDKFGYSLLLDEARVYILRREYGKAVGIYEKMLCETVSDTNCYVGIVRALSRDYSFFDDPKLPSAVELCEKVAAENINKLAPDLLAFLKKWHSEDDERRKREEQRRLAEAAALAAKKKEEELARRREARLEAERQAREKERLAREKAERDRLVRERVEGMRLLTQLVIENGTLVKYTGNAKNISLPETVVCIGEGAFRGNKTLETVVSSHGNLREIGKLAFNGCTALKSVRFAKGLVSIGDMAFGCCSQLSSVELPETVENIEAHAFWQCEKLTSVTLSRGGYFAKNAFPSGVRIKYV